MEEEKNRRHKYIICVFMDYYDLLGNKLGRDTDATHQKVNITFLKDDSRNEEYKQYEDDPILKLTPQEIRDKYISHFKSFYYSEEEYSKLFKDLKENISEGAITYSLDIDFCPIKDDLINNIPGNEEFFSTLFNTITSVYINANNSNIHVKLSNLEREMDILDIKNTFIEVDNKVKFTLKELNLLSTYLLNPSNETGSLLSIFTNKAEITGSNILNLVYLEIVNNKLESIDEVENRTVKLSGIKSTVNGYEIENRLNDCFVMINNFNNVEITDFTVYTDSEVSSCLRLSGNTNVSVSNITRINGQNTIPRRYILELNDYVKAKVNNISFVPNNDPLNFINKEMYAIAVSKLKSINELVITDSKLICCGLLQCIGENLNKLSVIDSDIKGISEFINIPKNIKSMSLINTKISVNEIIFVNIKDINVNDCEFKADLISFMSEDKVFISNSNIESDKLSFHLRNNTDLSIDSSKLKNKSDISIISGVDTNVSEEENSQNVNFSNTNIETDFIEIDSKSFSFLNSVIKLIKCFVKNAEFISDNTTFDFDNNIGKISFINTKLKSQSVVKLKNLDVDKSFSNNLLEFNNVKGELFVDLLDNKANANSWSFVKSKMKIDVDKTLSKEKSFVKFKVLDSEGSRFESKSKHIEIFPDLLDSEYVKAIRKDEIMDNGYFYYKNQ